MRSGEQIGPYTLSHKIGHGAFGEVWLAERRTEIATTKVALKIPLDSEANSELIKQEANLWVQASGHPNVLPIIEANIYDGRIVIVSEYAPDGSLSKWLVDHSGRAPSVEKAIEVTDGILAGLHHLHHRRIVHRDLKPQNILLQNEIPRLADFGISRVLSTSRSGIIAGTPQYMAPEAFDGERNEQTDIWSVGVVLYELLSGSLPFPQKALTTLMAAIINRTPDPLPSTVPTVLQELTLKALSKDPLIRFQSAAEMRTALRAAEKAIEQIRGGSTLIDPQEIPERTAPKEKAVARKNFSERLWQFLRNVWLIEPPHQPPKPRDVIKKWTLLKSWTGDYKSSPNAWSFDGKTLAGFYNRRASYDDGRIHVRRAKTGERAPICTLHLWHIPSGLSLVSLKFDENSLGDDDLINHGAFSPDARCFVSGVRSQTKRTGYRGRWRNLLQFWDTRTGNVERSIKISDSGEIGCMTYSPTGRYLAFYYSGEIKIWDFTRGSISKSFPSGLRWIQSLDFSVDEKLLVGTSSPDSGLRVWDWQNGRLHLSLLVGKSSFDTRPAFSPDGLTLAATNSDRQIVIWDLSTNELAHVLDTEDFDGSFLTYSPDGTTLACTLRDPEKLGLRFFDVRTGTLKDLLDETREVCWSTFSSDGNLLVNWCTDKTISLWKAE